MTPVVYRIAASTRTYDADDLTGTGAAISPGRWNAPGMHVVYTADSRALALLETFVHIGTQGFPANRYLVGIAIPDDVWEAREAPAAATLPVGWDARPSGIASERYGARWLTEARSAVLALPSVLMPEESVILINPRHPDAHRMIATTLRRIDYTVLESRAASG